MSGSRDDSDGTEHGDDAASDDPVSGDASSTEQPPAAEGETGGGSADSDPAGRSLAPDEQYCPSCGEPIKKAAEICPECGVRQEPATSTGKDRVTAGILALLLGGIGAHKFYLGETGMGILYLCFSWTLIPAFVGFIEGILYLTKSDVEFQRQYVN